MRSEYQAVKDTLAIYLVVDVRMYLVHQQTITDRHNEWNCSICLCNSECERNKAGFRHRCGVRLALAVFESFAKD